MRAVMLLFASFRRKKCPWPWQYFLVAVTLKHPSIRKKERKKIVAENFFTYAAVPEPVFQVQDDTYVGSLVADEARKQGFGASD